MNVLSLFDGMSCGQLALNKAGIGYDTYYASEIDAYAIKITQKNFPNTIQLGSITSVKAANLKPIDLLIGGSPCQGFSAAGKHLAFNDPRSQLFFEYVRILKECDPKYFLLENVKMKKQDQDIISGLLGVEPIMINSALVSAQNRLRLYWTNIPNVNQPQDKGILPSSILENNPDPKYNFSQTTINRFIRRKTRVLSATSPKFGTLIAGYSKLGSCSYGVDDGHTIRQLTPIEAERLQTVPDNYTEGVSNTRRYHALGNGWTVDVIAHILTNIKNSSTQP